MNTNTEEKKKRLELTNDYVFKKIFAKPENNVELKELLEAILNIQIEQVEVKNPEIGKNYEDEKLGILDIRAYINEDTIVDIEMQVANVYTIVNRNITYSSRIIAEQLQVGNNYTVLKKFISINILGENLFKRNSYHNIAHLKFEKTEQEKYVDIGYKEEQEVLTDKIEVHYIELKKFLKKNPGISSKLEQWLWLISGEEEKVKMASKENQNIKKVVEDLDEMSSDENERLEAYKRKLAVWDYNVSIAEATERGKAEGLEEGLKEGIEKGKIEGRLEGIAEGKKEARKSKLEIAKNLKQKGMDIETIAEVTGVSKEEIEKL